MTIKRLFRIAAWVLGTLAVAYFGLGSLFVYHVSKREETWHDRWVADAEPQRIDEWLLLRNDRPVIDWSYQNAKRQTYVVRIFEDRSYISAVYHYLASGQPARFAEGTVSGAEWRQLQETMEDLYAQRKELVKSHRKDRDNVRAMITHPDGLRATYRYNTARYEQAPQLYRDFDAQLFAAMQSWVVKPHHGYAKRRIALSYDREDLPNLARGLQSERQDLHASVVARMIALGEPALPVLVGTLRAGADQRYLPTSRYVAVLDGLAKLDDASGEGFALMKSLAEEPASIPGRRKLKKHAQDVVDQLEVDAYLAEYWAIPAETERMFRGSKLSPAQNEAMRAEIRHTWRRGDDDRQAAKAALIEMGPDILPAVLVQLRYEREERNRYNAVLLDVLGVLGGVDGLLFAILEDVVQASACVDPLRKLGDSGLVGVLKLLESDERFARHETAELLQSPEYADFISEYVSLLDRKLETFLVSPPGAVRELQQDAAVNLIKALRAHASSDAASLRVLLEAATDHRQSDITRIEALDTLAALGPAAGGAANELRALLGYESGRVRKTLLATLERIGNQ